MYGAMQQPHAPPPPAPPMDNGGQWVPTTDPNSGLQYYYHSVTRETRWDAPPAGTTTTNTQGAMPPSNGMQYGQDMTNMGAMPAQGNVRNPAAVAQSAGAAPLHQNHKSKMCAHFVESGFCSVGERCSFAHGPDDLRKPGSYGAVKAHEHPSQDMQSAGMYQQAPAQDMGYRMPSQDAGHAQQGYQQQGFQQQGMPQNMGGYHQPVPMANQMMNPYAAAPDMHAAHIPANALSGNHHNYKSRLCTNFSTNGSCSVNERCGFAHGEHELRVPGSYGRVFQNPHAQPPMGQHPAAMMSHTGVAVNPMFMGQGHGGYAAPMPKKHDDRLLKTKVCKIFAAGRSCQYGDQCRFAHGEQELKAPGDVVASTVLGAVAAIPSANPGPDPTTGQIGVTPPPAATTATPAEAPLVFAEGAEVVAEQPATTAEEPNSLKRAAEDVEADPEAKRVCAGEEA
eukprot:TRINITY_DN771_c0_g1_i2.p1 TRINITY_DN771_c0_g1~~TRINITY_DN771_c0_g1_i2.p1  ORF type:complete len:451 (-),score=87.21 TRINITY_DN771_c0_g1_i2:332-1684(-)